MHALGERGQSPLIAMTNDDIIHLVNTALRDAGAVGDVLVQEVLNGHRRQGVDPGEVPWDTLVCSMNSSLMRWLCMNNLLLKESRIDIGAARDALCLPERKSYIKYWIQDISTYYIPKAKEIFQNAE